MGNAVLGAQKKLLADLRKSRFSKKFESYHLNRNVYKIQTDLGIWILNHGFESYLQNRKQDKIQMPNMNLNLISQRSSKAISSGQVPVDCATITLVTWAMLTTGPRQKNIGRSEKSHDLARNLNPNARTGTQVRFKSILAFESKISDLNLNARTGTQVRFKSILAFESKISDLNLTC